eukprot:TRINITY_DN6367_c0_g2_i1.p1 TRINITY_DN6367_c0_g2~~TRINITY_DN6367_c0_g2_i1.p1  ORF type:complete len:387 (+),score=78.34 TRINITY_DN6367_c0_g2_i1:140-1300(+)
MKARRMENPTSSKQVRATQQLGYRSTGDKKSKNRKPEIKKMAKNSPIMSSDGSSDSDSDKGPLKPVSKKPSHKKEPKKVVNVESDEASNNEDDLKEQEEKTQKNKSKNIPKKSIPKSSGESIGESDEENEMERPALKKAPEIKRKGKAHIKKVSDSEAVSRKSDKVSSQLRKKVIKRETKKRKKSNSESDQEQTTLKEEPQKQSRPQSEDSDNMLPEKTPNKAEIEESKVEKVEKVKMTLDDDYSLVQSEICRSNFVEERTPAKPETYNRLVSKQLGEKMSDSMGESALMESFYAEPLPNTPAPNATINDWMYYVMELREIRNNLVKTNAKTTRKIVKIKEKSCKLEAELRTMNTDNNFVSAVESLLTEKRNEMKNFFTDLISSSH